MNKYKSLQRRVWEIVSVANPGDRASRVFDLTVVVTIIVSITGLVFQTVQSFYEVASQLFKVVEYVTIVVFAGEYFLRIWSCVAETSYSSGVLRGRLRFMITPLALVDLLAVVPSLLPFVGFDMRFIRAVWLFRLVRIAKLGRYSLALKMFERMIKQKKEELVTSMGALFILLLLSASCMYFAENKIQPQHFGSIPETMWWSIITVTTIGYGDVFPITILGKLITFVTAILGIGIAAVTTGVVASAFTEELRNKKLKFEMKHTEKCPTCGRKIEEK